MFMWICWKWMSKQSFYNGKGGKKRKVRTFIFLKNMFHRYHWYYRISYPLSHISSTAKMTPSMLSTRALFSTFFRSIVLTQSYRQFKTLTRISCKQRKKTNYLHWCRGIQVHVWCNLNIKIMNGTVIHCKLALYIRGDLISGTTKH